METEKDLNALIENQIEENTNLEYKDSRALNNKDEVAKDISAMANSNGGVIIYGLCEDNKDHKPTRIEWMENHQQKERIEQILQANVTPKIDVQIAPILSDKDKSKFVLVIKVPKSDTAPHQDHSNKDNRFYWRRNGYTTRQMEHYEIEDLFFKRKRAFLELSLEPCRTEKPSYNIIVSNNGKVMAEKLYIKLLVPNDLEISDKAWIKGGEGNDVFSDYCSIYQFFENTTPVYPEHSSIIGKLYVPKKTDFIEKLEVGFLIVSDNSELKTGKVILEYVSGEGLKQSIEYHPDKKSIPLPSIRFPWS